MGCEPGISDKSSESRIEGHRRTRKSSSSPSWSRINPWVRESRTSRPASGANTGAHAFTHSRVRSHELRAICNACIRTLCERIPRPPAGYTRAFTICAREIARSWWRFYRLSRISDRMRLGGEAANWTSAVSFARKNFNFFIVKSSVTSAKYGY